MRVRPGGICLIELVPITCPQRDYELSATKWVSFGVLVLHDVRDKARVLVHPDVVVLPSNGK